MNFFRASVFLLSSGAAAAFSPQSSLQHQRRGRTTTRSPSFGIVSRTSSGNNDNDNDNLFVMYMAQKVGVFFGTSTGATEDAAHLIVEEFGGDAGDEPIDIDSVSGSMADEFQKYDALIVGTPTWNTGADTERSGVGWDEVYYGEMQDLNVAGKKVAVFGLGDSVSYAENYADASGELHDVFEALGCKMMGYSSQEGYEHEASKAIRGDKFCGLLLDAVNQEELTPERVSKWVEQLKGEGILDGGEAGAAVAAAPVAASSAPEPAAQVVNGATTGSTVSSMEALEEENARLRKQLEDNSRMLDESIAEYGSGSTGYTPHTNANGKTMWTSADGRSCYYTSEKTTTSFHP